MLSLEVTNTMLFLVISLIRNCETEALIVFFVYVTLFHARSETVTGIETLDQLHSTHARRSITPSMWLVLPIASVVHFNNKINVNIHNVNCSTEVNIGHKKRWKYFFDIVLNRRLHSRNDINFTLTAWNR